ncbi:hypothetical protein [Bosea psychrotolerans]|uniref:hypothetical protein n=1 Tax=Bosea psychrotolerans TaxID=1871628 RepID=UPI000CDAB777|nr:hypothetical protein [Bosea psychrotolerans]
MDVNDHVTAWRRHGQRRAPISFQKPIRLLATSVIGAALGLIQGPWRVLQSLSAMMDEDACRLRTLLAGIASDRCDQSNS